jgi:SAM-dependent methyltransferase
MGRSRARKQNKNKVGQPDKRGKGKAGSRTLAEQADRHALYELSVQNVEQEVEFLEETFFFHRGRRPILLREDFCGTAQAACAWVATNRRHRAVAVDVDGEVLDWSRRRHVERLKPGARKRLELRQEDVREVSTAPADIICAFNFSYWYFKQRRVLLDYFRSVRRGLRKDGLFFLDVFGGAESYTECKEKTVHNGFTYIWEQASYDPLTADYVCHIHFKFADGSKLKRAFSYYWRLWTMPEIRELLDDAGFSTHHVYWQGTDDDGEASGEFFLADEGENDPAWIAYIVAEP